MTHREQIQNIIYKIGWILEDMNLEKAPKHLQELKDDIQNEVDKLVEIENEMYHDELNQTIKGE